MSQPIDLQTARDKQRRQCKFPGCTAEPPSTRGRRGRPADYCDDPTHNAQTRLRAVRKEADQEARRDPPRPKLRPVTDGIATVAGQLDRIVLLREELAALVADTAELLNEITMPESVDRQIADVEPEAAMKVAAAEQARADAERELAEMTQRCQHAENVERLALAAADEAADEAQVAREEAERIHTEAEARVSAAEADRDEIYQEAEETLARMRQQYDAARTAQARAEGERDAAREQANVTADENASLRCQLDERTEQHRQQLEARDLEYARAITAAHAMADRAAREQRQQVNEILQARHAVLGRTGDAREPTT